MSTGAGDTYPTGAGETYPTGAGDTYHPTEQESLGDLFGHLTRDMSDLVRSEMELARVEIREEAAKAGRAAGMLGGGALVAYLGLALLATAAAWGLAEVVDAGWAFLIVGLIVAAIGGALLAIGRSQLNKVRPVPEQTVETLKEDAQWARAQMK